MSYKNTTYLPPTPLLLSKSSFLNFFTGVVFAYGIVQLSLFLVFHTIVLFWALTSPFTFRKLKLSGHMHHIHIASIVLAIVLPLAAGLVPLKDGFLSTQYPTIVCLSRNVNYIYYPSCECQPCSLHKLASHSFLDSAQGIVCHLSQFCLNFGAVEVVLSQRKISKLYPL